MPPHDSICCVSPPTAGAGVLLLTAGGPRSSHLSRNAGATKCPSGSTNTGGEATKQDSPRADRGEPLEAVNLGSTKTHIKTPITATWRPPLNGAP